MIHFLTDRIQLSVLVWTFFLMLAFCSGLAVGLWIRRPTASLKEIVERTMKARPGDTIVLDESYFRALARAQLDTLDGTETVGELRQRCRIPEPTEDGPRGPSTGGVDR
jgi:hypothetical protein